MKTQRKGIHIQLPLGFGGYSEFSLIFDGEIGAFEWFEVFEIILEFLQHVYVWFTRTLGPCLMNGKIIPTFGHKMNLEYYFW